MKINSIKIENYKSIKKIQINSLSDFNVIIGENNIGKSSIFEALLLWKRCYDCSILSKGRGFYRLTRDTFRYLLFDDLEFLRVKNDIDLFNDPSKPISIKLKTC
jgi:AAA15 family ATPase/GTPase